MIVSSLDILGHDSLDILGHDFCFMNVVVLWQTQKIDLNHVII